MAAVASVVVNVWVASPAFCQFVTPVAPVETGPNLPAQPIGRNDLLAISVYGAPEFSRTVRVSEEGLIRLPMLREKIAVLGMLPAELETRLAEALEQAQILVDPAVTISIAEYQSHPISVVGAVKTPLTFQATGRTSLVEALTRAQGLSEDAGPEILITRPGKEGAAALVQRVPVRGLIDGADAGLNVLLEGGEEVQVPTMGRVYVVGNVKHPGGFRLDGAAGMSVLKALALSEGLEPYAAKLAYIYRRTDGAPTEIPVELRKLMDRKSADVQLAANDILYIPDNRTRRAAMTAIERAVGFATATTSGILVLGVR
jgi:polysaccharide export outer membrane protein